MNFIRGAINELIILGITISLIVLFSYLKSGMEPVNTETLRNTYGGK
jgi:hypothetical protein